MNATLEAILKTVQEGLSLWKSFIETREEAYRRNMDKRMRKCIDCAEKYILADESGDEKMKKKYKEQFFKFNQ